MKKTKENGSSVQPDPNIVKEINRNADGGALPCAVAFDIAAKLGIAPANVGKTADLINVSLSNCQLGLFGYQPNKKIVEPRPADEVTVTDAIRSGLVKDRLPCATAWNIATEKGISKLAVANACEAMGLRIKPCQLGAF